MTDIIEAGSDDEAIAGEHVGYVPCTDEPFAVDADDDSEAVDGSDAGYVPDLTEAGDFADSDDGQAVYGSAVGFIAKPCVACGPVICGITDDFNRTGSDLGRATCLLPWNVTLQTASADVITDGTVGAITITDRGELVAALVPPSPEWDASAIHSMQFSLDNFGDPAQAFAEKFDITFRPYSGIIRGVRVVIIPSDSSLWLQDDGPTPDDSAYSQITFTADVVSGTQIPLSFWVPDRIYTVSIETSGTDIIGALTDGTTVYSTSLGSVPDFIGEINFDVKRDLVAPYVTTVATTVSLDNLTVPEVTRCTVPNFDGFERSIGSGGWGTASPDPDGHVYSVSGSGATPTIGVHGASGLNFGYGFIQYATGLTQRQLVLPDPGPWTNAAGFTMSFWIWGNHEGADYVVHQADDLLYLLISIGVAGGFVDLATSTFDNEDFEPVALSASTWYQVELEYQPGVLARVKIWQSETAKPTLWTAAVAAAGDALSDDLRIGLFAPPAAPTEQRVTNIGFTYAGEPCYPGSTDTY